MTKPERSVTVDADREYFPPNTTLSVLTRDLRAAIKQADEVGSVEIDILAYTSQPGPWFCFNIGSLKYAIWRETGALYEVDQFGAVGDDPISGPRGPRGS